MKRLLRRLSRIADSSYAPLLPRSKPSRANRCRSYYIPHPDAGAAPVPAGHLPLFVEDPEGNGTPQRFVVPADLLTSPVIAALLRRSAEEYGYEQSGVLRIPCPVGVFQRVLDSLQQGDELFQLSAGEDDGEEWRFWADVEDGRRGDQPGGWSTQALHRGGAECCWCY